MKTAVIYARFSCNKQREASIEDQLRECNAWCAREGFAVVATYCDYAISGRTDERPEFQRMIKNAGESDIVLVYMLDRFSRSEYDAPYYKRKLREKGVALKSVTEYMPDGPDSILLDKVYEGLAAVESAHISQRTKRGMHGNALKCMHNGVPVYGYAFGDDGRYVVDEEQAAIVREVFSRKQLGESPNSIACDLASRGVMTSRKNPASHTFVQAMLRNEKYTGVYRFGDVKVEGGMPQIISKQEFELANAVKSKKQRLNEVWHDYRLAGRCMCKCCASNVVGVSGTSSSGKVYNYYRCSKKCGVSPIRADELEGEIVDALRTILRDRQLAREVSESFARFISDENDVARAVDAAKKRRNSAQTAIDNLLAAVTKGLDFDQARPLLERHTALKAAAEAEIETYANAPTFDVEDFTDFLMRGTTLDDKTLLDAFVGRVILGEEDITVVLNYTKEKCEPALLTLERVRTEMVWLPVGLTSRTLNLSFDAKSSSILVKLKRAA